MPTCDCGSWIQSGQQCRQCQLDDRYGDRITASTDGGTQIVAPGDEPVEPHIQCSCGARYHGLEAARGCCGGVEA